MNDRQRVAVLTTGRQDYGILRSTLLELRAAPDFDLQLLAGGMHLSADFGNTIEHVRAEFEIYDEIAFIGENRDPLSETASAVQVIGDSLARGKPDGLLLVGDRSETLAASIAATICGTRLIHLHGGEETEGAMDNAMRHAITKLSHLHLVSHADHRRRVIQMGEDPASVTTVGAPGLDNSFRNDLPALSDLERLLGLDLTGEFVLVTVHPTTLSVQGVLAEVKAVSEAMAMLEIGFVVTLPNADAGGAHICEFWNSWSQGRSNVRVVRSLGELNYWALLRHSSAILGNSSSGIIEAPSVGVPAINVGDRQLGRLRSPGVLDVPADPEWVLSALRTVLDGELTETPASPFLVGPAAPRIVEALRTRLPNVKRRKPFFDAS